MSEETKDSQESRRDVLKKGAKAAVFVIPMMASFNLDEVRAQASCDTCRYIKVKAHFEP